PSTQTPKGQRPCPSCLASRTSRTSSASPSTPSTNGAPKATGHPASASANTSATGPTTSTPGSTNRRWPDASTAITPGYVGHHPHLPAALWQVSSDRQLQGLRRRHATCGVCGADRGAGQTEAVGAVAGPRPSCGQSRATARLHRRRRGPVVVRRAGQVGQGPTDQADLPRNLGALSGED